MCIQDVYKVCYYLYILETVQNYEKPRNTCSIILRDCSFKRDRGRKLPPKGVPQFKNFKWNLPYCSIYQKGHKKESFQFNSCEGCEGYIDPFESYSVSKFEKFYLFLLLISIGFIAVTIQFRESSSDDFDISILNNLQQVLVGDHYSLKVIIKKI